MDALAAACWYAATKARLSEPTAMTATWTATRNNGPAIVAPKKKETLKLYVKETIHVVVFSSAWLVAHFLGFAWLVACVVVVVKLLELVKLRCFHSMFKKKRCTF